MMELTEKLKRCGEDIASKHACLIDEMLADIMNSTGASMGFDYYSRMAEQNLVQAKLLIMAALDELNSGR